ncbi:uncharacterized protein RHIMIDRAFT_242890 [Rhizopus microsporus ATCC 52813]|uniref:Uncharacterized protein n=1 Tax=Rhizopus microsporus ATCC 52813 TaxID=1340429 RepID=A0A2G4SEK2_RHIZD|nr:uncharacterized protein RHIMIDRAFT_242890 [Rhizopus microsporus ATCC 52813]PHZ07217.1 hypothetical protein RHIMIDRAFT_242890 [Rhizopus microsporus ATCC 52813]
MVDNPFIPRNVDQALTYNNETPHQTRYGHNNHHIELGDSNECAMPALLINNPQQFNTPNANSQFSNMRNTNQLATLDIGSLSRPQGSTKGQLVNTNQQQDLIQLIQQTIRNELNNQQNSQFPRNYNRYNRNNYNDGNNRYNRNSGNNFRTYNNDTQNQSKDNDQQPVQQQKQSKN